MFFNKIFLFTLYKKNRSDFYQSNLIFLNRFDFSLKGGHIHMTNLFKLILSSVCYMCVTTYHSTSYKRVYSCQYRTICDTYRIVYKKFSIVRAYHKCSWIVRYIDAYRMNRIVSVNCTYRTIHKHVALKWVFFFVKIYGFIWFKQVVRLY